MNSFSKVILVLYFRISKNLQSNYENILFFLLFICYENNQNNQNKRKKMFNFCFIDYWDVINFIYIFLYIFNIFFLFNNHWKASSMSNDTILFPDFIELFFEISMYTTEEMNPQWDSARKFGFPLIVYNVYQHTD